MNLPLTKPITKISDNYLIDVISTVRNQQINDQLSDREFVTFLKKHSPEEILYHCLQLPDQSISFFLILDRIETKKTGFGFLCDTIKYAIDHCNSFNISELVPQMLELCPSTVKTHIDLSDILHIFDTIETLRRQGYSGKSLNKEYILIEDLLRSKKGKPLDYQIELTIDTNFLIMVKLLYTDLDFAFHIYDFLLSSVNLNINNVFPFFILYLSILKSPDDPEKDFVPGWLTEFVLAKASRDIKLSNLTMTLLFKCRGGEYIKKLGYWRRLLQHIIFSNNYQYLIRAIPTSVIIFWDHFKDDFLPEMWLEIIKFFNTGDLRFDILEEMTYFV